MPGDEIDEFLRGAAPTAEQQPSQAPAGDEIDEFLGLPGGGMVDRGAGDFGVSLESGGDPWTRFRVGLAPTIEKKTQIMNERYGPTGYRQNERGEFIVPSQEGVAQPESLLSSRFFDPAEFTGEVLPEAAGGALAAAGTPASAGILGTSALGTLGAFAGASLSDVAQSPDQAGELIAKRAGEAPLNFGLEIGTLGLGKLGKKVVAPFAAGAQKAENKAIREAERALVERFGSQGDELLTVGERTGSKVVQRSEEMLSNLPGSSAKFSQDQARKAENLDRVYREIIGSPESTEAVGREVVDALNASSAAEREALEAYRERLVQEASAEVQEFGFGVLGGTRGVTPSEATEFARVRAASKLKEFSDTGAELYGRIEELPGGTDPIISADPIKKAIREVLESKPRKVPKQPGGIDAELRALEERAGNIPPSPEGEPFTLQGRLVQIAKQVEELDNMTFAQARELRSELNELAASPEALGDVTSGPFKKLAGAVTESMEESKRALRGTNPELADAIDEANAFYKKNRPAFDTKGIRELFKRADEPGFVADDKFFVSRVVNGDVASVRAIRDFLGPDSPEWRSQVGALWGEMVRRSRSDVLQSQWTEGMIDAKKLSTSIAKMPDDMAAMIFGDNKSEIFLRLKRLGATYGKVPAESLKTVGPLDVAIRKAESMAAEMDRKFKNNVVRPFLRNEVGISAVPPEQFVPFLNKNLGSGEGRALLSKLDAQNPELAQKVRSAMLLDLLESSETSGQLSDTIQGRIRSASAFADAPYKLDARELDRLVRSRYGSSSADSVKNFEAVFGKEAAQNLADLTVVLGAKNQTSMAAKSAGGLVTGGIIANMMGGNWTSLPRVLQYRIVASLATSKALKAWSRFTPGPTPARAKAMLGAGAMLLDDLRAEFSEEELPGVLSVLGVDPERMEQDRRKPQSIRIQNR